MIIKKCIIFVMFIAAVVFSTQVADSNTVKQKDKQSIVTPNNNTDKSKNTRSITVGNSKSNWSKIKDMFM